MRAFKYAVAVVAVALSWSVAKAQPPVWVGGPTPPSHLEGYSPFVPAIDPFPSKTSPYAHSMFLPGVGGKRVNPQLIIDPRRQCNTIIIEVRDAPGLKPKSAAPVMQAAAFEPVGPVVKPLPVQGMHRFDR